jgi:hypothetical protein
MLNPARVGHAGRHRTTPGLSCISTNVRRPVTGSTWAEEGRLEGPAERQGPLAFRAYRVARTCTVAPAGAYGTVRPSMATPSTSRLARAPSRPELATLIT